MKSSRQAFVTEGSIGESPDLNLWKATVRVTNGYWFGRGTRQIFSYELALLLIPGIPDSEEIERAIRGISSVVNRGRFTS